MPSRDRHAQHARRPRTMGAESPIAARETPTSGVRHTARSPTRRRPGSSQTSRHDDCRSAARLVPKCLVSGPTSPAGRVYLGSVCLTGELTGRAWCPGQCLVAQSSLQDPSSQVKRGCHLVATRGSRSGGSGATAWNRTIEKNRLRIEILKWWRRWDVDDGRVSSTAIWRTGERQARSAGSREHHNGWQARDDRSPEIVIWPRWSVCARSLRGRCVRFWLTVPGLTT